MRAKPTISLKQPVSDGLVNYLLDNPTVNRSKLIHFLLKEFLVRSGNLVPRDGHLVAVRIHGHPVTKTIPVPKLDPPTKIAARYPAARPSDSSKRDK